MLLAVSNLSSSSKNNQLLKVSNANNYQNKSFKGKSYLDAIEAVSGNEIKFPTIKTATEMKVYLRKLKYFLQIHYDNPIIYHIRTDEFLDYADTPAKVKLAGGIVQSAIKNNSFSHLHGMGAVMKSAATSKQAELKLDLLKELAALNSNHGQDFRFGGMRQSLDYDENNKIAKLVAMAETPEHANLMKTMAKLTDKKGEYVFSYSNIEQVASSMNLNTTAKTAKDKGIIVPYLMYKIFNAPAINKQSKVKSELTIKLYDQLKDKFSYKIGSHIADMVSGVLTAKDAEKMLSLVDDKKVLEELKSSVYSYCRKLENFDGTIENLKHAKANEVE